jgi:hypothetical protein
VPGTNIVARTYKSSGPTGSIVGCFWQRLSNTTDDPGTILVQDYAKGPSMVTIKRSDGAFKSDGCTTWQRLARRLRSPSFEACRFNTHKSLCGSARRWATAALDELWRRR